MRKYFSIVLAATMLMSAPPVFVSQSAQAASLFEVLFPRMAEQRRARLERRIKSQQRRFEEERALIRARVKDKKRRQTVTDVKVAVKES